MGMRQRPRLKGELDRRSKAFLRALSLPEGRVGGVQLFVTSDLAPLPAAGAHFRFLGVYHAQTLMTSPHNTQP
jgi:hypothetical protein